MTNGIELSQTKSKLIRNTDPQTASIIDDLYTRGVITDFSEDGWVLYKKEWYPFITFIEKDFVNVKCV